MKKLLLLFILFSTVGASAQYNLKFKVNGLKDTTIFLARYLGDKLYYADTAESKNGAVEFNNQFDEGVYTLICPGPKWFEIILADKEIEMETSISNFITNMKVKKSVNNKIFYDYIKFINQKKNEAKDKKDDKELMSRLDKEVKAYQNKLVAENKDLLVGKLINMSIDPIIPETIIKNDTLRYKYYKAHYWDNVDLSDKRLVHYPAFKNKLQFYFEKMLLQQADTICVNAHQLIKQIENGSEMFKYVVHFITYKYETSKIMGMDAVFYCMADSYNCPPDKSRAYWLDPDKLKELCERKDAIGPLRVGQPAPRVILADTSEKKWVDFYTQVKTDYTALIFWADDCGHCKKEMPKLIKLYNELKEKNISIEFVAVGTSLENKGWKKFIKENNLPWINISDFPDANENAIKYLNELRVTDLQSLNFRKTYDIFSTPQIYLLDKDKVIRAKKLDAKNLAKILEHKLSIDLDYEEPEEEEKKKEDTH